LAILGQLRVFASFFLTNFAATRLYHFGYFVVPAALSGLTVRKNCVPKGREWVN
jgi:hypothetical protein